MLLADFGTSYCKILDTGRNEAPRVVATRELPPDFRADLATGHNAGRRSHTSINELTALAWGGAQLIAEDDFVLLDCPPSLGVLMTSALAAADGLLIPIQCEYFGLEGLAKIVEVHDSISASGANPDVSIEGILMTMYDVRTNLAKSVVADVRKVFGDLVYDTVIPRSIALSEAPSYERTIIEYSPSSKGAVAYRELAREFLKKNGTTPKKSPPVQ